MRVLIAALLVCAFAFDANAAPRRIVSLDFCADQFVLALANRDQIAAVSRGALREDSFYRSRAAGLRQIRPELEEVLALRPDLLIRNFGGLADAGVYARFGIPIVQIGDTNDFAGAHADLLRAAAAIGQRERGNELAHDLDLRLERLAAAAPPHAPAVLYLSVGGAVAGERTMMGAVIDAAGGRNAATAPNWSMLPLERLTQMPPALIALGFFDTGRTRMDAWSPARHPVVRAALARARTLSLPAASVSCQAWYNIDAAERLAAALRS